MVVDVAADLRSNVWMSTQTIAFSLNAIYLFTQNNNVDDAYAFKYNWNGSWSDKLIPEKPIFETKLDVDKSDTFKFENIGNTDIFVSVTTSGVPALGEIISVHKNLKLSVIYKDMDGNVLDASSLKQGLDFYSEVSITNLGKYGDIENLALSNIFPSGYFVFSGAVPGNIICAITPILGFKF